MDYHDFFPYDSYRKNQEEVIQSLMEGFSSREHSLFIAPNGAGKTICNLVAAIPVILQNNLKLVYLCRTHTQNARVIEEIKKVNEKSNKEIKAVSIRGRKEMCIHKTVQKLKASPIDIMNICSDLRKNKNCAYFTNVMKLKRDSQLGRVMEKESIDAQELINVCIEKDICPYFFARFLMESAQIIIANYQWLFNPEIRSTFLAGAKIEDLNNILLIMDECHNLSDFLAEIDSSRLTNYTMTQARKELVAKNAHEDYLRMVDTWIEIFNELESKVKDEEYILDPNPILQKISRYVRVDSIDELQDVVLDLKEYGEGLLEEKISAGLNPIDFIGNMAQFMEKLIRIRDKRNYFFCMVPKQLKSGEKTIYMEIVSLDPREIAKPLFTGCFSTCSCSGTLNAETYTKILGINEHKRKINIIEIGSPFPKDHVKAILVDQLNTRYQNRDHTTYSNMNELIAEVLFNTPKNIGIFCASYNILDGLVKNGLLDLIRFSNKEIFLEDISNSASDNAKMIESYKAAASQRGAVLLGVCGGRNSEGEDFPGDFMNAVIIAGLPFHKPTPRMDAKIKYYDEVFGPGKGWNFAYLDPAIKRANQAAGRPIRTLDDKGAIILMDSRFAQYRHLLSKWIEQNLVVVPNKPNKIVEQLASFF